MSANGISHLPSKSARQAAKLAQAQIKRATASTPGFRPLHILDLGLRSPTAGRPWK